MLAGRDRPARRGTTPRRVTVRRRPDARRGGSPGAPPVPQAICEPGRPYKEIGGVIEDAIKGTGFRSVEQFCGHGIGKLFHTNPNVLHYRNKDPNGIMAVGHTFTPSSP